MGAELTTTDVAPGSRRTAPACVAQVPDALPGAKDGATPHGPRPVRSVLVITKKPKSLGAAGAQESLRPNPGAGAEESPDAGRARSPSAPSPRNPEPPSVKKT